VSILELAQAVAAEADPALEVIVKAPPTPGAPVDFYVPDTSRARELGLEAWTGLPEAIRRTAAFYRTAPDARRSALQKFLDFSSSGTRRIVLAQHALDQSALARLKMEDFFLDRVASDQLVTRDNPRLPDAVGAVRRLRLDGRVPPRIE